MKKAKSVGSKKKSETPKEPDTDKRFRQADFPLATLQQAQRIASAIEDNFAGKGSSPPDVALAIGISPTSSAWRTLTGSAIAYGLTEGGFNANKIMLTPLGKRLVAPEQEGDDFVARREAIMRPKILKEFFERYRRAKLPVDAIGINVLKGMGIPSERAAAALEIIKLNGGYAGIIRQTPTGPFINLDSPGVPAPAATPELGPNSSEEDGETLVPSNADTPLPSALITAAPPRFDSKNSRVFITHGKHKGIVTQIKELLAFGNFEPIVSVEREATAIPVPEKVFEDMRSCSAGVIHVGAEGKYLDKDAKEHPKINDNVLIEIGAAMALYGKKVILLVESGVILPSNLQGLYRCDYEGETLEYNATMKLLKTFSQFR